MILDIICVGAALVDMVALVDRFPEIDDEVFVPNLKFLCGGSAANTAVACSKLGLKTGFIGKIGDDPFGNLLINDFKNHNIDISNLIITKDLPTGNCYAAVDKLGNRILYAFSGAANELNPEEIKYDYIQNSRIVHLASLKNIKPLIKVAEIAKENNIVVSLNPGALIAEQKFEKIKDLIKNVDILIASKNEIEKIFNKNYEKSAKILKKYVKITVITLGQEGCKIYDNINNKNYLIPIFKVDVKDTTGAGDAFSAGFLAGYHLGKDIKFCGLMGNGAAALCIKEIGARNGLPTLDELLEFIERYQSG